MNWIHFQKFNLYTDNSPFHEWRVTCAQIISCYALFFITWLWDKTTTVCRPLFALNSYYNLILHNAFTQHAKHSSSISVHLCPNYVIDTNKRGTKSFLLPSAEVWTYQYVKCISDNYSNSPACRSIFLTGSLVSCPNLQFYGHLQLHDRIWMRGYRQS